MVFPTGTMDPFGQAVLLQDCPVNYRMFSSTLDLYPAVTSNTLVSNDDNQNRLITCPVAPVWEHCSAGTGTDRALTLG